MSSSDIKYPPMPLPAAEQARWTDEQMRYFARDTVLYNAPDAALVLDGLVLGTGTWDSIRAAQAALLHRGVKAETRHYYRSNGISFKRTGPAMEFHISKAVAPTREEAAALVSQYLGPTFTHSGGPYAGHNIPRKPEPEPFDLKRAQAGDPIQTRDGRAVKFVTFEADAAPHQQVIVKVNQRIQFRYADGRFMREARPCPGDLVMAPKPKRDVWVNTFKEATLGGVLSMVFESEEAALSHARCARSSFASIAVPQEIE